ncbi:efflux RND transporter permease subunit [Methylohalobius crimeensis]|uniref:efflux RND transporter permease subunit n=1 Tax=Methylohalobius crimeensis TaxID=244365 RepID=UPI0003B45B76|nr:efflux RND transporter permease subunit [Methylohalobius crimeensis]
MIEAIIKRGTLLAIGVLVLLMLGAIAVFRIPVQMIPDLEVRVISVHTVWPGATPRDVEKEILIEQEKYLRNLPSLQRIVSTASTGEAHIELEFAFGVDLNEALIRANNALSQVPAYPENVDEPRLYTSSFSNNAFMFFRVEPLPGNPKGVDMDLMRDFIKDHVATRIARVPGVSEVSIHGGAERQIQIRVDPARLADRGITLTELRDAIRARNRDISGGDIDSGKRRYLLRTVGRFDDLQEIENLLIRRQGDSITRLKDVAEIRLDHFEIVSESFLNGQPVIFISLRRTTGSNVIAIKDAVMPLMKEISRDLLEPMGMQMRHTADDVRYVEASVKKVWKNLLIGAGLASGVMFLFLRSLPATLVGMLGIPICTIAAFVGLLLAGRTINVISLAGVAFAIGMTLDNTIVVLESIESQRRQGLSRLKAAAAGVQRVWTAVLASTLTTVLVFAPILFVQEEAGQLYSDIAIAIAASIIASMLVSVTVIPTASSRLPLAAKAVSPGAERWLKQRILAGIGWLVGKPVRSVLCLIGVLAATLLAIAELTPPAEYLPEGEEPKAFASMIAPPGYSARTMNRIADELNTAFLPYLDDDPEQFARGETEVPALAYMILWTQPQLLRIIAETKDPGQIGRMMKIVDEKFREYPGMRAFSSQGSIITSNNGGTRSVNVDISGSNLQAIYGVASRVYRRAKEIFNHPRINSDPSSLILGQPLLEIRPKWERAAELGLDVEDIGYTVSAFTDGTYVDEYFLGDDKIDMYIYSDQGPITDLDQIPTLPIYTPRDTVIPMGAVTDLVETVDTDTIRRVDGRRTLTVRIIPPREIAFETAIDTVKKDLIQSLKNKSRVPPGVTLTITGASDQLDATREALSENFIIAILLSYLLLVAIFSHWGYPFVIMTTVPLGIAGGIIGLWLMNVVGAQLPLLGLAPLSQPFDMITMLGFLILVGTVVNNPILIVDQALTNLREQAMQPEEAVRAAVESRLRPILMSMITTVFGLAPLVFIPGAGTELYRGVGAIVLFGLFFATLVTLVFLPSLLVTLFHIRHRFMTARSSSNS